MEKYSVYDVARLVENEGLGYAITGYLGANHIADEELAGLWQAANDSMEAVENYLAEHDEEFEAE